MKNVCVRTPESLFMALDSFTALLFAPEVLVEIKRSILLPFVPLFFDDRGFAHSHLK